MNLNDRIETNFPINIVSQTSVSKLPKYTYLKHTPISITFHALRYGGRRRGVYVPASDLTPLNFTMQAHLLRASFQVTLLDPLGIAEFYERGSEQ